MINPKVSIIVPVYNVENYLENCIESILNQTLQDIELILVNDGSTDGCRKICDEYAKKDNRITVIHKDYGGVSSARNAGLDISKGKYIGVVDSDEYVDLEMYDKLYKLCESNNSDIAVCKLGRVIDGKLINNEELEINDNVKNPIVIYNKNNLDKNNISEKVLKNLILEDLDNFLKELGSGFCYIENEYKIKIGSTYNYIDLLLFNIKYNCYVVIELKVCELKKEHIGQIEVYMNYIDKHIKSINQDKTIGIIISRRDNHYYIEYSSDKRILTREYILT